MEGGDEGPPDPVERFFKDPAKAEDRQVVVVGAGPAGSAAARFAARAGADVLLVDRRSVVGTPMECAGFLPSRRELAAMLPDLPDQDELFNVPEQYVLDRTEETVIVGPSGRRKVMPFEGMTVDRRAWDPHNVDLAVEAGAEFRPSMAVVDLREGLLVTDRGTISGSVVIAADGPHSRTRRAAGLPEPRLISPALNAVARIEHEGRVEMHFCREAQGGYGWVIPAGDGRAHVGIGVDPRFNRGEIKSRLEAFAARGSMRSRLASCPPPGRSAGRSQAT